MRTLRVALLSLTLTAIFGSVAAQPYPTRPIRAVVPFPGGGGPMNVAGRVVQLMNAPLGQPIVLDNRPGGDGVIGADVVIKSNPDGHTLFVGSNSAIAGVPHLRLKPPYDPLTAFAPVGFIGYITFMLNVHPSLPAKSVQELIEQVRAAPGKWNYATGNVSGIVMMATFAKTHGLDMLHVPYKGDVAALSDFSAGRVQLMFSATSFLGLIRDGRLRALAVTLPKRSPLLPEVPTMEEAGVAPILLQVWAALFVPARTPDAVITRLNRELINVVRGEGRAMLEREGVVAQEMTPAQLAAHVKSQFDAWGRAIRAAGIPRD
ncbi:MAG: tripartite tricarboxylate transporter substrate binding protein [Betaproteobacteria bacterium]|nr:tripartite tricarboxylate transporter substrate binding protein [Betaproteobacteria bacterium]